MRQFAILTILLSFSCCSFSQELSSDGNKDKLAAVPKRDSSLIMPLLNCRRIETNAMFGKRADDWHTYLQKNLKTDVPLINVCPGGKYTVRIGFIVSKEGIVTKTKVVSNLGFGMEQEAIRVISTSPKWIPSTQNGGQTNSYHCAAIIFEVCTSPAI